MVGNDHPFIEENRFVVFETNLPVIEEERPPLSKTSPISLGVTGGRPPVKPPFLRDGFAGGPALHHGLFQ